eukprot:gene7275-8455_t
MRYYPFSTLPASVTTIEGVFSVRSPEVLHSLTQQITSPIHVKISTKDIGTLPTNITWLDICHDIPPIEPGYLPPSLKCLNFKDIQVSPSIAHGSLPSTLTHLFLKAPLTVGLLPSSITHLVTVDNYIEPGSIPNSVTHLAIGDNGNRPYEPGTIPNSVTYLKIFRAKTQIAPGVIPSSVTHLTGGCKTIFMPGSIPNSVTHLEFHQRDYGELPSSITRLRIPFTYVPKVKRKGDYIYDHFIFTIDNISALNPLPNPLPAEKLYNPLKMLQKFSGHAITIYYNGPGVSTSIQYRQINDQYALIHGSFASSMVPLHKLKTIAQGSLPSTLTHLLFGEHNDFSLTIGLLPSSITHLVTGSGFIEPKIPIAPDIIPSSVTLLAGGCNTIFIPGSIPNSVTHLEFHQRDYGELPSSIIRLRIPFIYVPKVKRETGDYISDKF